MSCGRGKKIKGSAFPTGISWGKEMPEDAFMHLDKNCEWNENGKKCFGL